MRQMRDEAMTNATHPPLIDWDRPVAGWIAFTALAAFVAVLMLVAA